MPCLHLIHMGLLWSKGTSIIGWIIAKDVHRGRRSVILGCKNAREMSFRGLIFHAPMHGPANLKPPVQGSPHPLSLVLKVGMGRMGISKAFNDRFLSFIRRVALIDRQHLYFVQSPLTLSYRDQCRLPFRLIPGAPDCTLLSRTVRTAIIECTRHLPPFEFASSQAAHFSFRVPLEKLISMEITIRRLQSAACSPS